MIAGRRIVVRRTKVRGHMSLVRRSFDEQKSNERPWMDRSLTNVPRRTKICNMTLEVMASQNAHELHGDGQRQRDAITL
jgi:hypothetical protein